MSKLKSCWTRCSARVVSFFRSVNPAKVIDFLKRVQGHAGRKFFVLLICNYLCISGAQGGLARAALLPYAKGLGYPGAVYQRVACISDIPYCLKGLMGTLSDVFPIAGHRRKYYMVLGALAGTAGVASLSFIPESVGREHVWLVSLSFFLCFFEVATLALMCAGTYSEMMVERPEIGSDFVTFCYLLYNVGSLVGRSVAGPVSDAVGGRPVYFIALPIALHVIVPILLNFLPEERVSSRGWSANLAKHKGLFTMALLIAASSVGLAVTSMIALAWLSVAYCCAVLMLLTLSLYYTLELVVAKCCTYVFLWTAVNVSVSAATDYFMTAPATCLKNGPHFTYTYYSTYTSVVGTFATLIAIWLFQCHFVNWSYVHVSWITSGIKGLAALFDYLIVTRATAQLGIPDAAAFLVGDAIVLPVIHALHSIPAFMLTSKLCPPGFESTAYAVMDGVSFAGRNISAQLGAFIIERSGISTTETHGCKFDNLGTLILSTQVAIPLATIPFTFCLLPHVPISADLKHCENVREEAVRQTPAAPSGAEAEAAHEPREECTEAR